MSAAVSGNAIVAGERTAANDVEHAEIVCQLPSFCFVNPHQRSVDDELLFHCHVERDVEATDEGISAVRITRKVCLAHSCYNVEGSDFTGIDSGNAEEEEVSPWYEGVGQCSRRLFLVHDDRTVCQRIVVQLRDETDVHQSEVDIVVSADFFCQLHLYAMLLPIDKRDGIDLFEMVLSPKEAGGRILSATQDNECAVAASPTAEAE